MLLGLLAGRRRGWLWARRSMAPTAYFISCSKVDRLEVELCVKYYEDLSKPGRQRTFAWLLEPAVGMEWGRWSACLVCTHSLWCNDGISAVVYKDTPQCGALDGIFQESAGVPLLPGSVQIPLWQASECCWLEVAVRLVAWKDTGTHTWCTLSPPSCPPGPWSLHSRNGLRGVLDPCLPPSSTPPSLSWRKYGGGTPFRAGFFTLEWAGVKL